MNKRIHFICGCFNMAATYYYIFKLIQLVIDICLYLELTDWKKKIEGQIYIGHEMPVLEFLSQEYCFLPKLLFMPYLNILNLESLVYSYLY